LKDLREKHAELEERLKKVEAIAEEPLKDKNVADDRAKSADKSLVEVNGQIKNLQDEIGDLKNFINKARDLTEEEVRKAKRE